MEKYLNIINKIENYIEDNCRELALGEIRQLKEKMIYDIAFKNTNKKGKTQLKSAKKILKSNKNRPLFQKIYKLQDSYMICNGFIGIILKDKIDGLELNDNPENMLDINNVLPTDLDFDYKEIKVDMIECEKMLIKNKQLKKENKKLEAFVLNINSLEIGVNPEYLIDTIGVLGDNVKIMCSKTSSEKPIYLESEAGKAIIMPIRL